VKKKNAEKKKELGKKGGIWQKKKGQREKGGKREVNSRKKKSPDDRRGEIKKLNRNWRGRGGNSVSALGGPTAWLGTRGDGSKEQLVKNQQYWYAQDKDAKKFRSRSARKTKNVVDDSSFRGEKIRKERITNVVLGKQWVI